MDKILLIDDEEDVLYSFRRIFEGAGVEIVSTTSGEEALKLLPKARPDLVIMDIRLSGMNGLETLRRVRDLDAKVPVIMMTAYGTTQTAIEAMKLGAYDYLLKPFDVPKLKELVASALKAARDMRQVVSYEQADDGDGDELGIIGRCDAMQTVFKLIGQLSASDATALITGESGTGKELVARAIYHHSRRSQRPFLAINCAAIPETLLESELFGHEKGAFTGAANQRIGKFEQCNGGTLFLDEIGDMSLATQTKILRVLQDGSLQRVGGNQMVSVDVRIIAATNKPLEAAVAAKSFREDLFYRLNVVRVPMPPLRERVGDIPMLVNYFVRKFCKAQGRRQLGIAPGTIEALEGYGWPGNVRELENVVRRALVVAKGDALLPMDLPPEVLHQGGKTAPPREVTGAPALVVPTRLDEPSAPQDELSTLSRALFAWARQDAKRKLIPAVERELVINALRETQGNQVQSAKLLGITRATLRKRIEKYGIKREFQVM